MKKAKGGMMRGGVMRGGILRGIMMMSIMSVLILKCSSSVEEISIEETQVDVDWSAKDLKMISEKMSVSIESDPVTRSEVYKETKPRWILTKELSNDTDEHINTRVIMEKIRTQLVKRRVARFIDDMAMDNALEQLNIQQTDLFDSSKVSQLGRFVGAKFLLRGRISNLRKRADDTEQVVYYNITLQVVDMETLEIIWTDEAEMARRGEKSSIRS